MIDKIPQIRSGVLFATLFTCPCSCSHHPAEKPSGHLANVDKLLGSASSPKDIIEITIHTGASTGRPWVFCRNDRPVAYSIEELDQWLSRQKQKRVKVTAGVPLMEESVTKIRNVCLKNSKEVIEFSEVSAMGPDWDRYAIPIGDGKIVSDRHGLLILP